MPRTDHITGPAFLLVIGRTVGMIAAFAIGPVLVRVFAADGDVGDVGTYKQFFLVFAILYGLAQVGMAESLYYFLPRGPQNVGRYVCNAAITLGLSGIAVLAVLWVARGSVAAYFNYPPLADYMVLLGLFLTFMLVGTVLEIMMVSRKQHLSAALTYALSDIVRTAFFIVPALLFASLRAVFIGAVMFAGIRLLVMLALVWRQFGREFRPDFRLWRSQLAYAMPFALAVGVEALMINYHQLVVGREFDRNLFAIYAIGVMTIPLMDLVVTSTTSVMMVKMSELSLDREKALTLYHDTVSRLAFLLCPLTVGLFALAYPFIVALNTASFAASVPVFMVWVFTIVPMMFAVDAMLRAYAQTKTLLIMNIVRFAVVASLIGWLIDSLGLVGAVVSTLTALVACKAIGLFRIKQVMQVSLVGVLPWAALARITARAIVAAIPAWALAEFFGATPWLALILGGATYGSLYLVLSYAPGIAEPAAIRLPIIERAQQLLTRRKPAPYVPVASIVSQGDR
jgi:O-antigen/teichoic acid export membrane protein